MTASKAANCKEAPMKLTDKGLKRFAMCLCVVWLGLAGRQGAQAPSMNVAPSNPTVTVGQTQQFTASGAITPTAASAGGEYTCVRLSDGTAQCTGRNQFGQLANGTWSNSSALVPVSGVTTATRVVAGDEFGCAVLTDATAKCWGLGEKGQRGDGTFTQISLVPVAVSGLTNAVAVAGGYTHACALLADGTMKCWGGNADGELGDPSTVGTDSSTPVTVSGISGAVAITTGAFHTCALLADATLRCWGLNGQGQLGDGTVTSSSTPVTVGLTGVAGVSGGGHHTCAVLADGTVQCWGNNYEGELGDGTTTPSSTPVRVLGITNAVAVSGGWAHTCARLADGTVQCWGDNSAGQLGNGTATNSSSPVPVSGIAGALVLTSGWWHHSCALLGDGSVRCWGANDWGQFGNGTTTASSTPVAMSGTGVTWTSSSTAVATVDATGRATAVHAGTTTITATDSTGATASTTLTVRDPVTLTVIPAGGGTGSVASTPPGINCGTDCSNLYNVGTSVTLTANASISSNFAGWSGCDTASGTTCTVTMNDPRAVTAAFDLKQFVLTVNRAGLGSALGSVSSSPAGVSCGTDCSATYTYNTVVTLTASPSMLVSGWNGCDTVSGATCIVNMNSVKSVTATFVGLP
jgi:alpha-tubulin suppressor-like RCC1 family protein